VAKKAGYKTLAELSFSRIGKAIEKMGSGEGVEFWKIAAR
jgi:hypothetical protein